MTDSPGAGSTVKTAVSRQEVDRQIDKMSKLPILPQILLNLNKVAEDESANAEDLGQIILKDQALTMRVLRVVNSAYYRQHLKEKITTVTKAVVVLGFNGIRRLALGMSVYDMLHKADKLPELRDFWSHALVTAIAARQLAGRWGYGSAEEAFVAGLVHDIGKLVLANCDPPLYLNIMQRSDSSASVRSAEREVFGLSHALAGKRLARRWGMPAELEEIIADHHAHEATEPGPAISPLLRVVIAANRFSAAVLPSPHMPQEEEEDRHLKQILDMNQVELEELMEVTMAEYQELAQTFEVEALPVLPAPEGHDEGHPEVDRDALLDQYQQLTLAVTRNSDSEAVIAEILDGIVACVAVDRLALLQVDSCGGELQCRASRGTITLEQAAIFGKSADTEESIVSRTMSLKSSQLLTLTGDSSPDPSPDQALLATLRCTAGATVPIVWQDRILGLIWLDNSSSGGPLSKEMLDATQTLANFIALVWGPHQDDTAS